MTDNISKRCLEVTEMQRTSLSLKKIYNQLRHTDYLEFFVRIDDRLEKQIIKDKKKQKQGNKSNKVLPEIPKKQRKLLTTKETKKYLISKEFPMRMVKEPQENDPKKLQKCSESKHSNRDSRQIILPNRINSLKLARYLNKRRSMQPCIRDPEDIIITKKAEIFHTQRVSSRNNAVQPCQNTQRRSLLSPIKLMIKKEKAKITQLQFPILTGFADFSTLIKEYHYFQSKQECYQYKAYVGKGNNSTLIKRLLKERGYWAIVDKCSEDVHFVWTQTKNSTLIKNLRKRELKTYQKVKKSEIIQQQNQSKFQSPGIAKVISNDMFKSITKAFKSSKKINMPTLLTQIKSKRIAKEVEHINPAQTLFLNHVDHASCIGNKKGLLYHMTEYYCSIYKNPFDVIPESIHLTDKPSLNDLKNIVTFGLPCILKPASGTNRGNGITIHNSWQSLHSAILQSSTAKSFVVQRYLQPFLYKNRKFDVRVWVLWFNGQAWWYSQGYLRTSSKEYNLKTCNRFVHLTNDAVQKKSEDYGKYQAGNKLSFSDFQKYLNQNNPGVNFMEAVSQMKSIAKDIFKASSPMMDPDNKAFGYELFGLDFMLDENFKVWLIQANTNPCLETSCSLLNRLITNMIDGVLNLTVDVVFEPPAKKKFKQWSLENFKFELIYDQHQVWNQSKAVQQIEFQTDQDQFDDNQQ